MLHNQDSTSTQAENNSLEVGAQSESHNDIRFSPEVFLNDKQQDVSISTSASKLQFLVKIITLNK